MGDGEGQDHNEGHQDIRLLDGLLERRREGPECASRELQKDGCGDCQTEGPEDEDRDLRGIMCA